MFDPDPEAPRGSTEPEAGLFQAEPSVGSPEDTAPHGPDEGPPRGHAAPGDVQRRAPEDQGPEDQEQGAGRASMAAPLSLMMFTTVMAFVLVTVTAFILSERSALRRADAAHFGALVDHATLTMSEDLIGAAMGDAQASERMRTALRRVASINGVRRASLLLPGAAEPWSESGPESGAHGSPRPIPLDGPQQQLEPDRLLVKRTFIATGQDRIPATLFLEAGYPGVERRMRDLIGLAGRVVGLAALFLVFLLPALTRLCLRPLSRLAEIADGEMLPESDGNVRELSAIAQRLRRDGEFMGQLAGAREDNVRAARAEVAGLHQERSALEARLGAALKEGRGAHAAKESFVANTSHEIRTPLHSMIGTTSLLLETELNAEQRTLAARALGSSEALLSLVEDIMDLTRFDTRSIKLEVEPFDAGALLHEVAELTAPAAATKGLRITGYADPELPTLHLGDARRVRQALMRLVDNAIKFTDSGEIVLEVRASADELGHPFTVFKVTDTGLGIGDRERARLFQAFEQLDKSDTRQHGGVGLGLALVARIARAAGGEVRLESRQGQGSTFRLALPLEPVARAEHAPSQGRRHQGVRIMLVDGAPGGAELTRRTLEESGAVVTVHQSAYKAFEALLEDEHDVLLLDPQVTGSEALFDAVRRSDLAVNPGVGLITSPTSGAKGLHAAFRAARASAPRPLSREALLSLVDGALGRAKSGADGGECRAARSLLASDIRRRVRILVVEDNPANQQLVQFLLGQQGYNVDVASNGMIAVEAATRNRYDVILMDCQMPEMDGYEATRRIRSIESMEGYRTPILAMTASILDGDRDRCLEAGMDDTIGKPFKPKAMMAWLERWLLASSRAEEAVALDFLPPEPETPAAPSILDIFGEAEGGATGAGAAKAGATEVADTESEAPGAPPAPPDFQQARGVLDLSILAPLFEDHEGRELGLELVETFLDKAPGLVEEMERALDGGDLPRCARIAHRFVSTSGTVGAVHLAKLLREVEERATAGHAEDATRLVGGCREQVGVAEGALRASLDPDDSAAG